MNQPLDPNTLKIPAYLRKKLIVSQSKQKLILTALDRKEAGLSHTSHKALAPLKSQHKTKNISHTPRSLVQKNSQPHGENIEDESFLKKSQKFEKIGTVTHYLDKINVAIIQLSAKIQQGDLLFVEGPDYLFCQVVEEMQIDRKPVKKAKVGNDIGLKISSQAKIGGSVYLA